MATHWTGCTPRQCAKGERPERTSLLGAQEWDMLYTEAEFLLNTHNDVFDCSLRQHAIRKALLPKFPDIISSPIGVERVKNDSMFFIKWTGADTILGERNIQLLNIKDSRFCLKSQHLCLKLNTESSASGEKRVQSAVVKDLKTGKQILISAKVFVVAAGAILSPQLLYASDIRPHALGRYLCEQSMAFCQIVLSNKIIEDIANSESASVKQHKVDNPKDPVPLPFDDPNPQLMWPVSSDHLYHGQINRDSLAQRGNAPTMDTRLVADLRWFSRCTPRMDNFVCFEEDCKDVFGMPQPTFHFTLSKQDSEEEELMMKEMCKVATTLGGYLPGSEPCLLKPGSAVYITGTTRMGGYKETLIQGGADDSSVPTDSVVNTFSQVFGCDNLYIGGCGVIPTGTACNPTLTAVALAIRAVSHLIDRLRKNEFDRS